MTASTQINPLTGIALPVEQPRQMKEMADFIKRCEEEGELLRIKKEGDLHLELGHVAKLSEERKGPALLFENIKGYDIPVLTSAFTTTKRFAIALNMPLDSSICDMSRRWMELQSSGRWTLYRHRTLPGNPGQGNRMDQLRNV